VRPILDIGPILNNNDRARCLANLAAPAGSALVASETAAWSWPPHAALARGSSITSALNASPVMAPHIHRENDIH